MPNVEVGSNEPLRTPGERRAADQLLEVANAHQIAALIPHARLELLEGVGHMFWWERPERVSALVHELALAARTPQ